MFAHVLNCVLISTLSRMYSCMPYHQNSLQCLAIQAYSSLHSTKVHSRSATQPGLWCQPEATRVSYYSETIHTLCSTHILGIHDPYIQVHDTILMRNKRLSQTNGEEIWRPLAECSWNFVGLLSRLLMIQQEVLTRSR